MTDDTDMICRLGKEAAKLEDELAWAKAETVTWKRVAERYWARIKALEGELKAAGERIRELEKSQGRSPKPHWEPHWGRGSMEEV